MAPLIVINVVGLTPRLLAHMPNVAKAGAAAALRPVLPAVTCSMQATLLTGSMPRDHGIVGNGWYFRDLGEVLLWRQHNALIQGDQLWTAAPGLRTANVCWWYAMGAPTDLLVTPRPVYHADGRKSPDCYTRPPSLHDDLEAALGPFPLFTYWGPNAGITSSEWIIAAARRILARERPDLLLVYVPHLDYDLQRYGPAGPEAIAAARAVDAALAPLLAEDAEVVVLSEYGITPVSRPVDINRALRTAGLLEVHTQAGMEYLDPWTSRAFAVADHQVAHVYVRDPADLGRTCAVVAELTGVDEVLDLAGRAKYGLDHERAGELVAVAEPDAWFTYYYWLSDDRAPDFARLVDIHRKPGYDPAELFMDPNDPFVKLRAAAALARKKLGFRYTMRVVPLDPAPVRGSHGRLPDLPDDGPLIIGPFDRDSYEATEVKDLLAGLARRSR
ncbi:nucleotide pyrophosphatase/phosphodiesterase family protein [Nonomuraea sp. NPDC049129]|uniref:nucleotide pyrophosphatase/phosphodiesterase family protein n=1 Tax=Nonomuraea sp. NPDC049129 TaxID=3155272 RepID=UPI0033F869FC